MKKYAVALVLFVLFLLVFYLFNMGVLSVNTLCGWKSGHLSKVTGKEWGCTCVGFKKNISSSYYERDYCTGINLSTNKFILNDKTSDLQHPVKLPE